MRLILRPFLLYLIALVILTHLFSWVVLRTQTSILEAALALFLLNTIAKPFLKILLLPINIITLGLFSWMIHVVIIFIALLVVPGFSLLQAQFPAVRIGRLLWPAIHLNQVWTMLLFAFIVSQLVNFISWLLTVRE